MNTTTARNFPTAAGITEMHILTGAPAPGAIEIDPPVIAEVTRPGANATAAEWDAWFVQEEEKAHARYMADMEAAAVEAAYYENPTDEALDHALHFRGKANTAFMAANPARATLYLLAAELLETLPILSHAYNPAVDVAVRADAPVVEIAASHGAPVMWVVRMDNAIRPVVAGDDIMWADAETAAECLADGDGWSEFASTGTYADLAADLESYMEPDCEPDYYEMSVRAARGRASRMMGY